MMRPRPTSDPVGADHRPRDSLQANTDDWTGSTSPDTVRVMTDGDHQPADGTRPNAAALDEREAYGPADPCVLSAGPDEHGRVVVTERDIDAWISFADPDGQDLTASTASLALLGWPRASRTAGAGGDRVDVGAVTVHGAWHAYLLDTTNGSSIRIGPVELAVLVAAGMEYAVTAAIEEADIEQALGAADIDDA